MIFGTHDETVAKKPELVKVILEIHRKAAEFTHGQPARDRRHGGAEARRRTAPRSSRRSAPNVELTWKLDADEVQGRPRPMPSTCCEQKQIRAAARLRDLPQHEVRRRARRAGLRRIERSSDLAATETGAGPSCAERGPSLRVRTAESLRRRLGAPSRRLRADRAARCCWRSGTSRPTQQCTRLIPPPREVASPCCTTSRSAASTTTPSARPCITHLLASMSGSTAASCWPPLFALPLGLLIGRITVVRAAARSAPAAAAADPGDGVAAAVDDLLRARPRKSAFSLVFLGAFYPILLNTDVRRALGRSASCSRPPPCSAATATRSSSRSCCRPRCRRSSTACASGTASPGS